MKPLIYIAGPYTSPDPIVNVRKAVVAGLDLYDTGLVVPLIPHLTAFAHFVRPEPIDFWYRLDLDQLAHCDALYRLPGASVGADNEETAAVLADIPVFDSVLDLCMWAGEEWRPPKTEETS